MVCTAVCLVRVTPLVLIASLCGPCLLQEEKAKAYKKEKQKERKRRAEDDVELEEDDEMAAVMGFSGFGSSKKSH